MAIEGETTFSAATPSEAVRGAGGKLRRQPARKHSATPYSRPPQNQTLRSRWISRIVDPAYRIIAGGASRILPYFFSKADSATDFPALGSPEQDQDELRNSQEHVDASVLTPSLNNIGSRTTEVGGTSSTANRDKPNYNISTQAKGKIAINDNGGLSELERLMEGRKFSRDEIERLIEIINSRAVDLPVAEREKKNLESPFEEEARKFTISLGNGKKPSSGKEEAINSDLWTTSTPLPKSTMPDEVGLSPIELARAYMGSQTPGIGSKGLVPRDEREFLHEDMFVAKSFITSPVSKPSTYWPGGKLTEQHGFATPQSQRERFGLHNFPRTPYSRTILSKSKSKLMQLHDDSSKRLNIPQSPSHRMTPYGQFKLRKEMDEKHGSSVGPNRRVPNRAITGTTSRFSPYSRSVGGSRPTENSEGFFPAIKKNLESGEPSTFLRSEATNGKHKTPEVGTATVPPHSSQIARTILEHLERNPPTPKDKSAELKLATSWRKTQQASDVTRQSSLNINNTNRNTTSAGLNEDKRSFFSNTPPSVSNASSGTIDEAENAISKAPASNGIFGVKHATNSSHTTPLFEFGKPKDSLAKTRRQEDSTKADTAPSSQKPPSHLQGSKPTLPSISITKPMQRWTYPSDSSASFTFPVSSSSSGASSEPPTPSFIPVSNQKTEEKHEEIPTYSFGTNKSTSALVFSFPDIPVREEGDDDNDITFTFGTENARRISFSSLGKDTVCC